MGDCKTLLTVHCKLKTVYSTSFSSFSSPQGATTCDFGTPPGINVEETSEMPPNAQRFGFYLVNIGTPLINASLAILVDGVSLLYVAHSGVIEVVSLKIDFLWFDM